jgi:hypothetical protein
LHKASPEWRLSLRISERVVRQAVWSELVSATENPVERQFSGTLRAICPSNTCCFRREGRISVMARHAFQLELLREFALA